MDGVADGWRMARDGNHLRRFEKEINNGRLGEFGTLIFTNLR